MSYIDLSEGFFYLLLVFFIVPQLVVVERVVLFCLVHAGSCISSKIPWSFFLHSSLCMVVHSLMKFSVSGLILSSRVLSRILTLLKRRRRRRISSPVSRSKWQKGRRRPRLSAARLKFLILPNSLRRRVMTSLLHSYGIFLMNIFCHTFCSGRTG